MYQAHAQKLLNQKESENAVAPGDMAEASADRVFGALERLEKNLKHITVAQARDVQQQRQLSELEKENVTLREERESLMRSLKQLQEQYDDLQRVASSIYGKLDNAISRISKVVDNNA